MDPKTPINPSPPPQLPPATKERDFLLHLEAYLAKRDGVDKLLKISRYATKVILSSSLLPPEQSPLLTRRLKSFESSVGLSRKAFRLGKFIQDINSLRATTTSSYPTTTTRLLLSVLSYGGEGIYYFIEQFVWLTKSGLLDSRHARPLQLASAWAELVGYVGSIALKIGDLNDLNDKLACVGSSVEIAELRGEGCGEEIEKVRALKKKVVMKKMSILQDFADGFMALADVRDGKGKLSGPFLLSCAGLLSALISTHKNWVSC